MLLRIRSFTLHFRLLLTFVIILGLTAHQPVSGASSATLTVNRLDDDAGASACAGVPNDCSLRGAITRANLTPDPDTILLPSGTYPLSLSGPNENNNATGDLDITSDLTITGDSASTSILDGGNIDRVLHVMSGVTVEIQYITIRNGRSAPGGGIYSSGNLTIRHSIVTENSTGADLTGGGGISVDHGTLKIINSLISNNNGRTWGGAIDNNGGAVDITGSTFSGNTAGDAGFMDNYSGGTLTIADSTFVNNTATGAGGGSVGGGAIINESDATTSITNSTFTNNSSFKVGGAIYNQYKLTITNSTFSGNSAADGSGTISNTNSLVTITNSILAVNSSQANCKGTVIIASHNIDTGSTCGWASKNGSKSNTNPKLGPLSNNGGRTQTMALLANSPAINAGDHSVCPVTDQRGIIRPNDPGCDIGAFEVVQRYFAYLSGIFH